jgi:hypothetical protein
MMLLILKPLQTLISPSQIQIYPLMWETKFHMATESKIKLFDCTYI